MGCPRDFRSRKTAKQDPMRIGFPSLDNLLIASFRCGESWEQPVCRKQKTNRSRTQAHPPTRESMPFRPTWWSVGGAIECRTNDESRLHTGRRTDRARQTKRRTEWQRERERESKRAHRREGREQDPEKGAGDSHGDEETFPRAATHRWSLVVGSS